MYAAEDLRLRRDVAIKMLHPHLREQQDILSRFRAEARAVASLKHRHIVEVYDVASPDDFETYMVAERIHGTTLRKILRALGPFPAEVAGELILAVLAGLEAAHEAGMVHRDIKPENVMITGVGDDGALLPGGEVCVKVMDFGVAKWAGASGMTVTGQMLGSPAHMAPEQIEGGAVDARTDVFAVGILLYELLTGELPFRGGSPAQSFHKILSGVFEPADLLRPSVGRRWARLLTKALAVDPEQRYASASAFGDDVRGECLRLMQAETPQLYDYLADPPAFIRVYNASIVTRLCELGAQAHAARDFLSASDDINRASALAPLDEKVISLLGRLSRTRRDAGLVRAGLYAVAGLLGLALLAAGVWRMRGPWFAATPAELEVVPAREMLVTGNAGALQGGLVATDQQSPPVGESKLSDASARAASRMLRLGVVVPGAGVLVSVDGAAPVAVREGETLPLSNARHELKYSCVQDMCVPQSRRVAAGASEVVGDVRLSVRPATLTVDGDPNHGYSAVERPNLALRSGASVTVAMSQGVQVLTVVQDASGERRDVVLRAGQASVVKF